MVLCVHSSANTTTTQSGHFDNGVIYCRLRVTDHFDDQHASTRRNIVRPIQYKVQLLASTSTMNFDQASIGGNCSEIGSWGRRQWLSKSYNTYTAFGFFSIIVIRFVALRREYLTIVIINNIINIIVVVVILFNI